MAELARFPPPLSKPLASSLCHVCSRAPLDDAFSRDKSLCYEIGTPAEVKSRAATCALCSACDAHLASVSSCLADDGKARYQVWLDIAETAVFRLCSRKTLHWGTEDSEEADWHPARLPFDIYMGPVALVQLFKPSQYEEREPWCEKPPEMLIQPRQVAHGGHLGIPVGTDEAQYLTATHLETMMKSATACLQEHTLCSGDDTPQRDGGAGGLVFRLIDVDDRIVRLADQSEEYACLSYMWGDSHRLSRLSLFADTGGRDPLEPRPLPEQLPRTLEDVLWVVRSLGLRHVWIDAYCIDQTNEAEAELAFANMDSVYERAVLTVCPFWVDSDAGLHGVSMPFADRNFRMLGDDYVSWYYQDEHPLDEEVSGTPWHSRGWIFQESLLSRQRLCFLPSSIYLTCCEQQLSSHHRVRNTRPEKLALHRNGSTDASIKGLLSSHEWDMETYNIIVGGYSPRKLTYQVDALNALRGVLNVLSRRTGMEFAYALPRGDLVNGVMWNRIFSLRSREENPWFNKGRVHFLRRPEFPSWSWLGYRSEARYDLQLRVVDGGGAVPSAEAPPLRGRLHWWDYNPHKTEVRILRLADMSIGPGAMPSTPLTIVSEMVEASLLRWPQHNRPDVPELQWRVDVPLAQHCKLTRHSNHSTLFVDSDLADLLDEGGGKIRVQLLMLAHIKAAEMKMVDPRPRWATKRPGEASKICEIGDVVLVMVVYALQSVYPLQKADHYERIGVVAVPYEFWVQSGPAPCRACIC